MKKAAVLILFLLVFAFYMCSCTNENKAESSSSDLSSVQSEEVAESTPESSVVSTVVQSEAAVSKLSDEEESRYKADMNSIINDLLGS